MAQSQSAVFDAPKLEDGFRRLESPELYKFEKRGDQIIGVLSSVSTVEIESDDRAGKKQRVTQFLFMRPDAPPVKILGTYDLCQKITRGEIGCVLQVTFLGEDQKIKRGNNYMKVFDVQAKGTPTPRGDGPITDDDIPF